VKHVAVRPAGPYSLALTARRAGDATRAYRDGVFRAVLPVGERLEQVAAAQRRDGDVRLVAESDAGLDRLRYVLALDDDHTEFLRRFRRDRLLRGPIQELAGMRQIRLGTVAHALLRALCGQLIPSSVARAMERRIVRATTPKVGRLHAPPGGAALAALSPAELRKLGLHARRGATLVRLCRSLDLERLRALPSDAVAERLQRERGLGPWSVGVICLEGLGRREYGLVGDLGLVKLAVALRGGGVWVEAHETAELLEPYGEWAGLASLYLMAGFGRGLIPLPEGARIRKPPHRIQSRAA
jgi:3-methyladenine DNA glycosylase/8-oxoguanine DNA glycosylase